MSFCSEDLYDLDGKLVVASNYQNVATSKTSIKPLRIAQNYNLFGGYAELNHGKIVWDKKLNKVSKKVQEFMSSRGSALRNKSPEVPHESFLVALAQTYREKVWRLLDEKTKSTVRLVSRLFKKEIDLFCGLEVIVNDELEGNLEFIESVEAVEVCLLHLKNSYFKANRKQLFRCNWNIETIDIWMPMSFLPYRYLVLDCAQTLQCLYFREMALIKKYISASKADESQTHYFPCLTTIILYYGYFDTPFQVFRIFNSNMRYILNSFECPRLSNLQVLPEPSVIDDLLTGKRSIPLESCKWESHPLKSFISRHRKSMTKLKLVLYRNTLAPEKENYHPPTNLVEYVILFPMLENTYVKNFRSFWRIILQAQVEAQVISSQAELWGDFSLMTQSLRKNIFLFSAQTLSKIYLESYHRKLPGEAENTHVLDLKQFATFTNLIELHLTVVEVGKKNDVFQVHHLSSLPRKLEVLVVEGFQCLTTELIFISLLPKLRNVTLRRCGDEGIYGVNFEVARALLIHKTIKIVIFGGFNEKNDTRLLYALIKKFNMGQYGTEVEVLNPRGRISFIDWFPCCCCMKPHGEENLNIH